MSDKQLIIQEVKEPAKVFVEGGTEPFIKAVKAIVKDFKPDLSTASSRKEIASLAHSVARSKTYLDNKGKDYVSEIKAKAKVIDSERKKWRDTMDQIKAEVRKPLDDFEEAEKKRIADIEERIEEFNRLSFSEYTPEDISSGDLKKKMTEVKSIEVDDSFEELKHEAIEAKMKATDRLELLIASAEKREAEKAELERLRKEKEEKEAKEREERIRREAIKEAEEKAKAEKEAHEKAMKEAEEREKRQAEENKRKIKEAEERAKREAAEAAEAERQKEEAKKRAEEEAKRKREEDIKHRKKINNEALKAFVDGGLSEDDAKQAVTLIASKNIPNVFISY